MTLRSFDEDHGHTADGHTADGWAVGPDGQRFWGRFGAAGVLLQDPDRGVLLQLRAEWCDAGGTWGIPGGALLAGEAPLDGAFREAEEEAGVTADDVAVEAVTVLDLGFWSYTTVVARPRRSIDPQICSTESVLLRWVPADEVASLPLHPGFATTWAELRREPGEAAA